MCSDQEIPGPPPSGPRFPVPIESGNGDSLLFCYSVRTRYWASPFCFMEKRIFERAASQARRSLPIGDTAKGISKTVQEPHFASRADSVLPLSELATISMRFIDLRPLSFSESLAFALKALLAHRVWFSRHAQSRQRPGSPV